MTLNRNVGINELTLHDWTHKQADAIIESRNTFIDSGNKKRSYLVVWLSLPQSI